jgi:uncharacterized protein YgiM (DUF1202 family)
MKNVLILILAVLLLFTVVLEGHAAGGTVATVTATAINVRQGPGTTYPVIGVAYAGDSLSVTGQNAASGWYQVQLAGGRSGWVSGSLVTVTGDTQSIPLVPAPATGAATAVAATTTGAAQAGGNTLVFQVNSGGPIYVTQVGADGTAAGPRYLTTGMDPALSPDRQWVAFTRWDGVQNGVTGSLWVIKVDGSNERQVMSGANQPKSPTWSTDGKQIVINMQQGGAVDNIYLCMVDGKPVQSPTPVAGARCMPQQADPHWGLRLVDVTTGEYEDLPHDAHSFAPTWDPANTWHVVYRGDLGISSLDLNQKTTWLVKKTGAQRGPIFSPDGQKLATTFKQNDHWEVHVMNADGNNEVRLTQTPSSVIIAQELQGQTAKAWNNAAPAWSPDGSQIAFITDRNGSYEIWVMNADGTNQRPLLTAAALGGLDIQYNGVDERVLSWR